MSFCPSGRANLTGQKLFSVTGAAAFGLRAAAALGIVGAAASLRAAAASLRAAAFGSAASRWRGRLADVDVVLALLDGLDDGSLCVTGCNEVELCVVTERLELCAWLPDHLHTSDVLGIVRQS